MIRCYITDRRTCPGELLDNIARVARTGVDYIQLREKDLSARELIAVTRAAVQQIEGTATKLIVNSRADVAVAAGAHGVHLPSDSIEALEWKRAFPGLVVGVSCHTPDDLASAAAADYLFYSPVFDSPGKGPPIGLEALAAATRLTAIPVLALGGITWQNAEECVRAGAAGIAAIRLFQT